MAYRGFKGLTRRTASDKILRDITKNPKYDGDQRGLASMIYKFFDKKLLVVVLIWEYVRSAITGRIAETSY